MSAPSRKANRNPRRKAGRAAGKSRAKKLAFSLTIEAQEMRVTYTPNYTKGDYAMGHFEFRSPHRPARRIIVSETGYLSRFVAMADVREAVSPKAYARELVLMSLRQASKNHDARQLGLF